MRQYDNTEPSSKCKDRYRNILKSNYDAICIETVHASLNGIVRSLMQRQSIDDVLKQIVSSATQLLDISHGWIELYDENRKVAVTKVAMGIVAQDVGKERNGNVGLGEIVRRTGEAIIIDDYSSWEQRFTEPHCDQMHCMVQVPLKAEDKVIGSFGLVSLDAERKISQDEVSLLTQFGALASIALYNAQLFAAYEEELLLRKRSEEALAKSEERYRLALEAASDGFWDYDFNKDEVFYSERLAELTGIAPGQKLTLDEFTRQVIPSKELPKMYAAAQAHLEGRTPFFFFVFRWDKPTGVCWLYIRGRRQCDTNGQPVRVVGSVTDITVSKEMEIQLRDKNVQLNTLNHEVTALYQQVAASEEEMRAQYEELLTTKEALAKSEDRYRLAIEGANDGIWDHDFINDRLYLSERSREIMKLEPREYWTMQEFMDAVVVPEDMDKFNEVRGTYAFGETPYFTCVHRVKTVPGVLVLVKSKLVCDEAGKPVRMAGSHTDITAEYAKNDELKRKNEELVSLFSELSATEEELRAQFEELETARDAFMRSEERYKLAVEGSRDGIWDWDALKDELYLSDRSAEIFGFYPNRVMTIAEYRNRFIYPEDRAMIMQMAEEMVKTCNTEFTCEHRVITPRGIKWVLVRSKSLYNACGRIIRVAGSHTDITDRKKNEETISYLAYHDFLTGLFNRAAFDDKLQKTIEHCLVSSCTGMLISIDLDNFKVINDTYGHGFGDKVLCYVGQKLSKVANNGAFAVRTGGDEFVLLFEQVSDRGEAEGYVNQVIQLFAKPIVLSGKLIYLTASSGVFMFPDEVSTADEVLKCADLALFRAKAQGKNQCAFFDRAIDTVTKRRMRMEQSLRSAFDQNEFRLLYQPQIDAKTGEIYGFEALIRWNSREYGFVLPMEFIGLAEETGLIVPIGRWVLREACQFLSLLRKEGYCDLSISVNVSALELLQNDYVQVVKRIIEEEGVPASFLGLEITESMLMESYESNRDKLEKIRQLGVAIYLDDFGTGYSSLKHLKNLPIDYIKIDKSFVADLADGDSDKELIEPILELARRSGIKTVVEGVETEYQLKKLTSYGCDLVQGYYFNPPVSEDKAKSILKEDSRL
ncbi:MAG: hypothetical protein H6Q73_1053 [Firmicutes bacterium]|nr:hypothetical protein [Bacillota bacterium]